VPLGDNPPLNTAVSRITPPRVVADAFVDTVKGGETGPVTGGEDRKFGGVTGADGVTGAGGFTGGGGSTGGGGATGQLAIVRLSVPELELPSRVWEEVHAEDAVTVPLSLAIGTVSENELPGKDANPCVVVGVPPVGRNTTVHSGVLSPPLPLP
jgi:hypothetical protein